MMISEAEKIESIKTILNIISSKMVIPLYLSFWILDVIYVPQYMWEFLAIRLSVIPCAIYVNSLSKKLNNFSSLQKLALFYVFYLAGILNAMIYIIGPNGLYDNLLHLVSIGSLSFIPFSRRYFALSVLAIYAPYYLTEFSQVDLSQQYSERVINSFIIFSIVFITVIIKMYHDNFHQKEIKLRQELENEYLKTKKVEQELIIARDQAISAAQAKSAFLANMSHEIRTPLTAIIGFSKLLNNRNQSVEQKQSNIKTIIKNSEHLLHIVNDILDFSKIEAKKLEIVKKPFSLFNFMNDIRSLVYNNITVKGLDFDIQYQYPLPETINTDEVRLKQILINLCGNSSKFTHQGYIHINVSYDINRNQLLFSVSDTGIGMSPKQVSIIFDSFTQADSGITKAYGGTGLGLSISKELSEKLGGDIEVTSEENIGSCFTCFIDPGPASELKLVDTLPQSASTALESSTFDVTEKVSGKVLLVEDTVDNQVLIGAYLEEMGASMTIANNGQECLNVINDESFDLILMDMQMPVLNGYDTLLKLQELGCKTPVVMLTGNAFEEDRQKCLAAGCVDFIAKPIDIDHFQAVVYQNLNEELIENTTQNKTVSHSPTTELERTNCSSESQEDESLAPIISTLAGRSEKFNQIIINFICNLDNFISKLDSSYNENDIATLMTESHRLKGVGGNIGFKVLTKICENIEENVKNNNLDIVKNQLKELKLVAQRINLGIDRYSSNS